MGGNPREHVKDKGFWDGGTPSHGKNGESAGRAGGFPGTRKPQRVGIKTDLEFPSGEGAEENDATNPVEGRNRNSNAPP